MSATLVCGIDEAGRGPVIGPLVLACVLVDEKGRDRLRKLKVKDSKLLTPRRRGELEPQIKEIVIEWRTHHIQPSDIDRLRKTMSLNDIEARKTAQMILSLNSTPARIIVDAADTVEANYGRRIIEHLNRLQPDYIVPQIISEHKADVNHIEVSAASVIAKVERDRCVEGLKEKYGELGSGYPSDETTRQFLRQTIRNGTLPDCVRRSWSTLDKNKQTTLGEY